MSWQRLTTRPLRMVALVMLTLGLVLLTLMALVEGEPGLVPLLIVVGGVAALVAERWIIGRP